MAEIRIQGPDGSSFSFPEGTTVDIISEAMDSHYGGASTGESPSFLQSVGGAIDGGVRMIANGMTFGLADKAAGGMDALTGQAESYDEGVEAQRARTQGLRDTHPYAAGAAELAGGLIGGVGAVRSGATLAGRLGSGLVGRMTAFGAEGGLYGAAHGAGNTYSDKPDDYAANAWNGAKWGGPLGAAIPAGGSIAGAAFRGAQAVAGPAIEGAGRTASTFLRGAAQADEAGLRALPQMGPEAMLVDAGPSMLGLGQGAGTGVGQGRTLLVNALRDRDAGTGQRLAGTLDETLGPAPVPSQVRAGLDESRERIGERYGQLPMESTVVDPRELAESLDAMAYRLRGPAQTAVRKVRGYLNQARNPNEPAPTPGQPVERLATDAETLFQTRQAIDGLMTGEVDPKVIRQLTIARQSVDEMLDHSVPGLKQVDGQFQEIARQDDALTRGGQVFDTGKTATRPVELAQEIQEGALPAGEMIGPSGVPYRMRQGARAEVDRLVGTHVNDLNTLERTLATPQDWNSQKFASVFGEPQFNAVAEALNTNRRFRQSYQDIVQGSQTGQRQAAQKALDGETRRLPIDATMTGAAAGGVNAVWRALMNLSRDATKDEIGKLLSAKGPDAVKIMESLLARAQAAKAGSQAATAAIENPAYLGASGQYGGRR